MQIYILFLILLLAMWRGKLINRQGCVILAIMLFMMLVLRDWGMGLYDTKQVYLVSFNRMKYFTLKQAFADKHITYEPLTTILIWVCANWFNSFPLLLVVSAFFAVLPVIYIFMHSVENNDISNGNSYFAVLLYFCLFYFYSFFLLKQVIAIGFFVFAFYSMQNKKIKNYLFWITLAGLTHKSAWILLIVWPLCRWFKFSKKTVLILVGMAVVGVIAPSMILEFIYRYDPTNMIRYYIKEGVYSQGTGRLNFGVFLNFSILIFCWYRQRHVPMEIRKVYDDMLTLYAIGSVVNSYSGIVVEFYRLAFYFTIYSCCLIPIALKTMSKQRNYSIYRALVILMFIIYGLARTAVNTNCMPYKFFF